ncbi:MAG: hypothetical protein JW963_12620 [Anaerolineales bacterium]|nr:hypothetical protein [Anaerolineales bacterium]
MNTHTSNFSFPLRVSIALGIIVMTMSLTGCGGEATCPVITRFEAEPQWVCPGQDFSPKVNFRIENFDEDGNPSSDGPCLWKLWDTTNGKPNQPGAVALTNNVGTLNNPSAGVFETPGGVHVVSGSQAAGYQFTLIASNTECSQDGEEALRRQQARIEELYGVELDDNEVMTAITTVELVSISGPQKLLCLPHVSDVQSGFTWVKDEARAGNRVVINGVENLYPFPLEVERGSLYAVLQPRGDPGAKTTVFDGQSPNGKWAVKALVSTDYDNYIQHGLDYVGKPSICLIVQLACE